MNRKIIFFKFGAIGDILMAMPAFLALIDRHGNDNVIWFIGENYKKLLIDLLPEAKFYTFNSDILFSSNYIHILREIISVNLKILSINPSKIYLLHKSSLFSLLCVIRYSKTIKLAKKQNKWNSFTLNRYQGYSFFELIFGYKFATDNFLNYINKLKLVLLSSSKSYEIKSQNYILLCPGYAPSSGSTNLNRRILPINKWIEIANFYRKKGIDVFVVGSAKERNIIGNHFTNKENLCGLTTFTNLIFLFKNANNIYCTDNGLLHLAYMTTHKVIAIMGPTPISAFLPPNFPRENIIQTNIPCIPCYDGRRTYQCHNNSCISSINFNSFLQKKIENK